MRLTCLKELLVENINTVIKAVSNKTTLNILECILLIADDNGFSLIGNNLELGIETSSINADIIEKGSVALEARVFSEIVKRLPDENVTVSVDDKNIATITSGASEYKILGQSGEEFPFLTEVEKDNVFKISSVEFKDMIKQTIFSVAIDDSKPIMTGELLEIRDNSIKLLAVDGFRISIKESKIEVNGSDVSFVIPAKTLSEISKILSSDEEQFIEIFFTDKHILFQLDNCIVVSRLLEGDFIDYENLFTQDYTTLISVNREEMLSCLDRASLISKDAKKNPVKISIDNNKMSIDSNTEIGTSHEEMFIETDGVPLEISFNPRYLIECLKVMDDEKISIQFTTALSPCIIKGEENDSYKYLILPLRVKK